MVTLKTFGGLANRMRAIDSAYQLAKEKNTELSVIWELSHELNCSFFKLFEPVQEFQVNEYYISRNLKRVRNVLHKSFKVIGLNIPFGYNKYLFDKDIETAKQDNNLGMLFSGMENTYISTVHQFFTKPDSFSYFKPLVELQEKINYITGLFSSYTIGIHIRRSDNRLSVQHSPREAFIKEMQKEIDDMPEVKFFLATDSYSEEQYIFEAFHGRVITFHKQLDRNSESGIRDALVDLYCLANTQKILGSYYSSFSEVAAQINKIPLTCIIGFAELKVHKFNKI